MSGDFMVLSAVMCCGVVSLILDMVGFNNEVEEVKCYI